MITKVDGIIASCSDYGDTSKIIQVFTSDKGIISILCKGAKSMKSKLRALTMKYTYGSFYIYYKKDKLSILKDVDILENFNNIMNDIILLSYLNYIVDLSIQVFKQSNNKEIYNLLISTIKKLDEQKEPLILSNILEIKYLKYLGVNFNLDKCVMCNNTTNIVTLDPDIGGFVCKNCYTNQVILSKSAIKLIRMYYYVEIDSISNIKISENVKNEINLFIEKYYDNYTGIYLNSKKFCQKLKNMVS